MLQAGKILLQHAISQHLSEFFWNNSHKTQLCMHVARAVRIVRKTLSGVIEVAVADNASIPAAVVAVGMLKLCHSSSVRDRLPSRRRAEIRLIAAAEVRGVAEADE